MLEQNNPSNKPPIPSLNDAAISFHEMYLSFRAAGFNDSNAMYLVGLSFQDVLTRSKE